MKLFHAGEKGRIICPDCKRVVPTTFAYRDVPFDDGSGIVKDILAAVCDVCGSVAAIPAQSTPSIRRSRELADISLEVMLPAPEMDVLDAAAYRIDPQATGKFRKSLLAYYIHKIAAGSGAAQLLQNHVASRKAARAAARRAGLLAAMPRKRLSFKIAARTDAELRALMQATGLAKTDLTMGLVGEIETTLVRPESPVELNKLRDLAAVVNA